MSDRRGALMLVGLCLVVALALVVGLRVGVGVNLDAPTITLAVTAIVLVAALRSLWGIVVALSRPPVDSLVADAEAAAERSNLAELREDKRRVLRAIKELEFDHAMGKLSDEDFKQVGDRYRLRAIELLRQLDVGDELHPQLLAHLQSLGVVPTKEASP